MTTTTPQVVIDGTTYHLFYVDHMIPLAERAGYPTNLYRAEVIRGLREVRSALFADFEDELDLRVIYVVLTRYVFDDISLLLSLIKLQGPL